MYINFNIYAWAFPWIEKQDVRDDMALCQMPINIMTMSQKYKLKAVRVGYFLTIVSRCLEWLLMRVKCKIPEYASKTCPEESLKRF